jgi:hypothetical protein
MAWVTTGRCPKEKVPLLPQQLIKDGFTILQIEKTTTHLDLYLGKGAGRVRLKVIEEEDPNEPWSVLIIGGRLLILFWLYFPDLDAFGSLGRSLHAFGALNDDATSPQS